MPKISAVMALYNTPYELLEVTVKSILNQSVSDFELVVIDDASTVDYENFFKKFNDERIKYFKLEKNAGPGHARNEGIKKAIGEYVAIVDSDDVYMPKRFELQSIILDKNLDVSLLSSAFRFSNKKKICPVLENYEDIKVAMLFNSALTNPAVMFRREVFVEKNLFYPENINFGEDYSLWIDAMFSGVKVTNLNKVLMIYTRRKNQLSKTKSNEQVSILKTLYAKIFSKLCMEFSQQEIDLHYNIYAQKFDYVSVEEVSSWFDKIIEYNKMQNVFDEKKLTDKKKQTIEAINKSRGRLFKLKIFDYNVCLYKPLKIAFERRD